ncbi:hypothetical protein INT45_014038 [Circinella minor]|uniref:Ndc10 domain-containing protein n=1 Tax=Circinella minor TaxID=1195481 RepID=A0A8H7RVA3_9FUNG|nr:hypothetical protein INT45_014038 [Circinella minor]
MGGSGSGQRQINGTPAQNRERNRDIRLDELSLNNSAVADMENDEDAAYRDARDRAALETFSAARQSRPQNTINQYLNRQQEFKRWCIKKNVNAIPDDGKLHFFLKTEVAFRPHRKRGKKRSTPEDSYEDDANQHHSNEHGSNGGTNINNDDADDDLNDLPQIDAAYQVMDMMDEMDEERDGLSSITLTTNNSSPPPINSINTESPITQQFDEYARLASGVTGKRVRYSTVEAYAAPIVDLWAEQCLTDNSFRPSPRGKLVKALLDWLRREDKKIARANFDDRHYGLLRGESIRKMEFTDLQSLHLEDEGPSQCHALLIKGTTEDPQKELSYRQHLKAITKAFEGACLHSKAKTHAMRGAAARMAEIGGSSEGAIRRAGRWNTSSLTTAYLTNLPHELLRTLAGFPTERGYFYLSHANVQPPKERCKKIFKFVDYWRQKLDEGNVEQVSCATDMFLKLLDRLRVVFLQDSVLLKKRYPHHYLWNHPLFQSELYKDFERSVDAAMEITEEPEQLQLQRAVPLVAQHLSNINQQIASRFDA